MSRFSLDKVLVGGCLFIILVIFPSTLYFWHTNPQAEQQASDVERQAAYTVTDVQPDIADNLGPAIVQQGVKAVSFPSTTVDGRKYFFDGASPHIKIVEFWATWCGPCHMSIPVMIDLDRSLRSSGVETIGVSVDTDTASRVAPFAKAMGMDYTVLVDPQKNSLAQYIYHADGLPSLYIIDGKGIIRWSFSGYTPDEEQYVRQIIDDIQNGQPVPAQ